ncbi:MAG: sigma 54-interacting transcriptional regulator, partial [Deltaproteobacteria bacterium]|nr:sigma 54-interacting transcriptional regulator [Deltaproteobacteria bacterium]
EIHEGSGRSGPFVALDCGGLPDDLVHSELFGHVEGAFPGADRDRTGLLEAARGGTLFLNEIGGASLVLQGNLLRFLEEGAARPLGSDRAIQSDARVIVSTDRSLRELVEAGSFREDLLARLSRGEILVPPLRERREDIVPLATYFARRYTDGPVVISRALAVALLIHPWPGNVRELQGVVERAAVEGVEEDRVELTPWLEEVLRPEVDDGTSPLVGTEPRTRPEPEVLVAALRARVGNVSVAATDLGVSRSTLYRWMRDVRIDLERLSYEWEDLTDPWP